MVFPFRSRGTGLSARLCFDALVGVFRIGLTLGSSIVIVLVVVFLVFIGMHFLASARPELIEKTGFLHLVEVSRIDHFPWLDVFSSRLGGRDFFEIGFEAI